VNPSAHVLTLVEDTSHPTAIYRWRCSCGAESQYDAPRPAYAEWEFRDHVIAAMPPITRKRAEHVRYS